MKFSGSENKFLNSLVNDCLIFRLTEKEALDYIEKRFKKISEACYKNRKARIMSDESTELWLNHFTRVGFITHHREQIDTIRMIQRDSIESLQIEKQKEPRNQLLILKMREDIRENTRLLSELGVGTPIIAAIKAKMQRHPILPQSQSHFQPIGEWSRNGNDKDAVGEGEETKD